MVEALAVVSPGEQTTINDSLKLFGNDFIAATANIYLIKEPLS